jgi:hypothetical protein
MSENGSDLLERLAYYREETAKLEDELTTAIASVIPPDVQKAIDEVKAELQPDIDQARKKAAETEQAIRDYVILNGESEKGGGLEAVICSGRVSWDTKGLDKAIALIPGLAEFRKKGEPYVTIRSVKGDG